MGVCVSKGPRNKGNASGSYYGVLRRRGKATGCREGLIPSEGTVICIKLVSGNVSHMVDIIPRRNLLFMEFTKESPMVIRSVKEREMKIARGKDVTLVERNCHQFYVIN